MTGLDTHLSALFEEFVATTQSRAPLYSAIARICARAAWCHELMAAAPPLQRLPVLWCACLHRICLDNPGDPFSEYFATVVTDGEKLRPPEALQPAEISAFCDRHRSHLEHLLSTRHTQTNEVGRCALLVPVLSQISQDTGHPLRLLDVGSSAGLNLHVDKYSYRYEPGGEIRGDPRSPVLTCAVRGSLAIPDRVPEITARRGVDLHPLDVSEPEDAAWLRACVWADQRDRSRTLEAAIGVALRYREKVHTGDAVADLAHHLEQMAGDGHLVVITTWVLSYLSSDQILEFIETLQRFGEHSDLTWVGAEQPDQITPIEVSVSESSQHHTHVITREWRKGHMCQTTWATAHPHGYWMHWEPRSQTF
jgi:hypothetical protein